MSRQTLTKMVFIAFMAMLALAGAEEMVKAPEKMEESTVSPIADMAIIDAEVKSTTERPTVVEAPMPDGPKPEAPKLEPPKPEATKPEEKPQPTSQRHTVADFIIHPLIAFKPRNPEDVVGAAAAAGKQANSVSTTPTPTTSPWQFFGFNAGQGLGSLVSGWINDRIQFPGIVETPVRGESTTTSTTTTTTERPDVIVRVQHKASTRPPLISIQNNNRPNLPPLDSNEENDDEDENEDEDDHDHELDRDHDHDEDHNNSSGESTDDNGNDGSNEVQESNEEDETPNKTHDEEEEHTEDDEEEENHSQRPNHKRRPLRNGNTQRRRVRPQQQQQQSHRRHQSANHSQRPQRRRRPSAAEQNENEASVENSQDDEDNNEDYNSSANNDDFYFPKSRPSTKRSQSNANFIQRGQQQLINQIRQLTRGQSPAEVGNIIRKAQRGNNNKRRRPQQATLFINRNGQTVYYAPELNPMAVPQFQQFYGQPIAQKPVKSTTYPQPPLTVPLKRKGQPTQYITIPWSQLGISPPTNLVSITEGIQAQPFILNIPQSAINTMQNQAINGRPKKKKKNRPQLITADAVPLLAESSLMDIFKPPVIPPSRHQPMASKPALSVVNATPVIVAAKPASTSTKTSSSLFQQHIRPGTIVEKAPEMVETKQPVSETSETNGAPSNEEDGVKISMLRAGPDEKDYILVGQDNEPGITRQVEPVYGQARRFVRVGGNSQFYDFLPRRHFNVRRGGRNLEVPEEMSQDAATEQQIPVKIISEPEVSTMGGSEKMPQSESAQSEAPAMETVLSDPKPEQPKQETMMTT